MDVVSTCPLRVGSILWQPRTGVMALTVVCKATFVLCPGECTLAHEQDAPNDADEYWNDDGCSSQFARIRRRDPTQERPFCA